MAWGFWSASTVTDRGRSPRRATTVNSSAIYYQSQPQQCNVTMNQCIQPDEVSVKSMPMSAQQQQPKSSVCGTPTCQSVCHSPTCHSPSCQSVATGNLINFYSLNNLLLIKNVLSF
jgi:hypothetical protein